MTDYLTIFAPLIAFAIGLVVGSLHQYSIDEAELDQLTAENRHLRKRLAQALCRYRAKSQAVKRLQKYVDQNWYAKVGDVDEDDYWSQDDPDYVARVEDTLRNWGPVE